MKLKMVLATASLLIAGHCIASQQEQDKEPAPTPQKEQSAESSTTSTLEETADYLRGNLDVFMQDTAAWLDGLSMYESDTHRARAKGYVQLSWLPQRANLGEFDAKFKVKFYLPKWENRISLVLDNDDEDDLKLDYEAEPIIQEDSDRLNIALQSLTEFENLLSLKYRLGLSRGQLYARTELKKSFVFSNFEFSVSPRIDYFSSDGWAPGLKSAVTYPMGKDLISASVSWQKFQFEPYAEEKAGIYWVRNLEDEKLLVSGVQYVKYSDGIDAYLTSVRYREKIYKDWAYLEVEPFVLFKKPLDYRREFGIGLRLISTYGE